jgi:hypothetical protein
MTPDMKLLNLYPEVGSYLDEIVMHSLLDDISGDERNYQTSLIYND